MRARQPPSELAEPKPCKLGKASESDRPRAQQAESRAGSSARSPTACKTRASQSRVACETASAEGRGLLLAQPPRAQLRVPPRSSDRNSRTRAREPDSFELSWQPSEPAWQPLSRRRQDRSHWRRRRLRRARWLTLNSDSDSDSLICWQQEAHTNYQGWLMMMMMNNFHPSPLSSLVTRQRKHSRIFERFRAFEHNWLN